ncbi:hypothetical protein [Dolichospermum circinale]|uniref:hypothetical protein n=1 Tax=Dolichospermum circinale TaxID=109265 RepID=UPI00233071DD|nr:hypothetical protein [Dolichospermum circinale]MDB9451242.1 hypothetical protein [Dolichospermum circinale CS-547]
MSVGAKHLEDKLSVIAKNSSPNASPVQLLVGAKHLEDKLSVIAKNSSPNASPVQLLVVFSLPLNTKDHEFNKVSNFV